MKKITEQELKELPNHFALTVGDLLKFIEKNNIPKDAKILVERIEDVYFLKHGWDVYLEEGEYTSYDENNKPIEDTLYQYIPLCTSLYNKNKKDILFLSSHY